LTTFNSAGLFNITVFYISSQNYSSSLETWWVNVSASVDIVYPTFSNYYDNNASLVDSGIATFNVTVVNTNGSVFLDINGANYTATNLTTSVYNVSVSLTAGVYAYYWGAWGMGLIIIII